MSNPAEIMAVLYDDLTRWAASQGGVVSLTQNPFELLEMLRRPPNGWRLTLHWSGDQVTDPRVRTGGVVDNTFRLVIDGQLGPTAIPRIEIIRPGHRRTPMLALIEAVRYRLMQYRFAGLNPPNDGLWYRGTNDNVPLPDGISIAAWNVEFMLRTTKAQPTAEETINLGAQ
jgi:hypothetical protein